jgi:hypothetical protein
MDLDGAAANMDASPLVRIISCANGGAVISQHTPYSVSARVG